MADDTGRDKGSEAQQRHGSEPPHVPRRQAEAPQNLLRAGYNYVIGDDINALRDPKASRERKAFAAGNIVEDLTPTGILTNLAVRGARNDVDTLENPKASTSQKIIAGMSLAATFVPGIGEEKVAAEPLIDGVEAIAKDVAADAAEREAKTIADGAGQGGKWRPASVAKSILRGAKDEVRAIHADYAQGAREILDDPQHIGRHSVRFVHDKGKDIVTGAVVGTTVTLATQLVTSRLIKDQDSNAPTVIENGVEKRLQNGFHVTGTVESFNDMDLVVNDRRSATEYQFLTAALAAHAGDPSVVYHAITSAQRSGTELEMRYEHGQMSIRNTGRHPQPHSFTPLPPGAHFRGRVTYLGGDQVIIRSATGVQYRFDSQEMLERAQDSSALSRALTQSQADGEDISLAVGSNGKVTVAEQRTQARDGRRSR